MSRFLFGLITMLCALGSKAQVEKKVLTFSAETELQAWVQQGYSFGAYAWLPNARWNIGILIAGSEQQGAAKSFIYQNGDALDAVRNTWLVAARVRYFFKPTAKGFYTSLNIGYEQFRATENNVDAYQNNGFVTPFLGYAWFLKGSKGVYLQPAFGAIVVLGRGGEKTLEGVNYRLNPVFPNPTFTVGFKFR